VYISLMIVFLFLMLLIGIAVIKFDNKIEKENNKTFLEWIFDKIK